MFDVWYIYTGASTDSVAPAEVYQQLAVRGRLGNWKVKDEAGTGEAGGEDETVGEGGGHGRDRSTEKDKVGSAHRRGESTGEEWEMGEDREREKHKTMTGGGMRSQIEAEREGRVGVVASPLDCY